LDTSVLIRAARLDDAARVAQIVAEAYAPYVLRIGRKPAPMAVDYRTMVDTTDRVTVIVDESDDPVGVLVTVVHTDHVLVENVAVARSAQGRGLGRRLLEHAEDQALRLGLPETRLYTNAAMTENLAIYPRLGYAEVNRRTEDGFDRVYFRKDLRS
jgi:ribosomal protein S18 acetylase RimI-like enzyme